MAFPGDVNSLGSVSGSQTLAAAGHATRHNEVKTALEGLRDVLGGTAVPSGTVQPILAAGSASAPSLSFTGDSNTGLWSPAADTLAVSTGGTERMRVDNAGLITGTGTSLGAWTTYTPLVSSGTGSITSYTASGRYTQVGKTVTVTFDVNLTNAGTAATSLSISVPVASVTGGVFIGAGREYQITGYMCQLLLGSNSSSLTLYKWDNTFIGSTGHRFYGTLTYEVA